MIERYEGRKAEDFFMGSQSFGIHLQGAKNGRIKISTIMTVLPDASCLGFISESLGNS